MFYLKKVTAGTLKVPALALPKGMVFALRAVGSHIKNVETTLMEYPKDLVRKVLMEKFERFVTEHPEARDFFYHHEEDLIRNGTIRISVGIFNTFRSSKLIDKYEKADIPSNSITQDAEALISNRVFDIYDGVTTLEIFNYINAMTKNFSYLPLSASIVKQHESKIGALVKEILSYKGDFSKTDLKKYYDEEDLEELKKLRLTPKEFAVEQHSYVIGQE